MARAASSRRPAGVGKRSTGPVHLVKVCVGVGSVEQLQQFQAERVARGEALRHVTRHRPKRDGDLLNGGSLSWIIAGALRVRQRVIGLDPVETEDGVKCALVLDPELVRTEPFPRGPHQGWRYLAAKDAPPDLPSGGGGDEMPDELRMKLREMGVL